MVTRPGLVLAALFLAGCAGSYSPGEAPGRAASQPADVQEEVQPGVVESVRRVPLPGAGGTGIATMGGMIAGGIAGASVGSGRGSAAASVLGSIAGAVAGNAIESAGSGVEGLEISVRLDSGRLIAVVQPDGEAFKPGERVRVISGARGRRVTH